VNVFGNALKKIIYVPIKKKKKKNSKNSEHLETPLILYIINTVVNLIMILGNFLFIHKYNFWGKIPLLSILLVDHYCFAFDGHKK